VLTLIAVSVVALLASFASLAHYAGALSGARKAVGEDAAFEISATARRASFARPPCSAVVSSAAKCPLDMVRRRFTVLSAGVLQPGFKAGLDDAIPQRPLGTAALVALGSGRSALSRDCHRVAPSWSGSRDMRLYIYTAIAHGSAAAAWRSS